MLVDPTPGGKIPDDLKISIGVQPESGRLPEVVYAAERDRQSRAGRIQDSAEFDRDEFWRYGLIVQSSAGSGEALSRVEATPPGYGRWDLALILLPFLAVALLWFRWHVAASQQEKKSKTCRPLESRRPPGNAAVS